MASLLSLPVELLGYIAQDLENVGDVSALSRSCRHLYDATICTLYRRVKDDPEVLHRAVKNGHVRTVRGLLAAGADPNVAWVQRYPAINFIHETQLAHSQSSSFQLTRMIKAVNEKIASSDEKGEHHVIAQIDTYSDLADDDSAYDEYWSDEFGDSYDSNLEDEDSSDIDFESESSSESEDDNDDNDNDDEDEVMNDMTLPRQYYWTPLHVAAFSGNVDVVELLLNYGANIHALSRGFCKCSYPTAQCSKSVKKPVYPLWMPLHTAICHGHEPIAHLLLSRGASIHVSTRGLGISDERVTALHSACYSGSTSLSRFLINRGYQTDVDCEDHLEMSPMSYAYYSGNWECIDLLVEHGATPDARLGPFTLFKHACFYSRFHEAFRFVELGADLDLSLHMTEMSPLHCCCQQPYYNSRNRLRPPLRAAKQVALRDTMVKVILETGADIDKRDHDSETPLMQAACFHLASVVELLLAAGANPKIRIGGQIALFSACGSHVTSRKGELLRIVKALLPYISNSKDYETALASICETDNRIDKSEVVHLFLERGASACLKRMVGQSMFAQAIVHSNLEVADILLENGLRPPNTTELLNIIDSTIQWDNPSGLKYLVDKFPDSGEMMKSGPLLYQALLSRHGKCARFLIKAGAPVSYRGPDGTTSLIRASAFTGTSLAKMLLKRGADPNEISQGHHSPLSFPIIKGNVEMIRLLLDHGIDTILFDQGEAVRVLMNHGADIHRKLTIRVSLPFDDTTPLEYAIGSRSASLRLIEYMLLNSPLKNYTGLFPGDSSSDSDSDSDDDTSSGLLKGVDVAAYGRTEPLDVRGLAIDYTHAACQRHKPEVFRLLFGRVGRLDPNLRNDDGHTPLALFCQAVEIGLEDAEFTAPMVAVRSMGCVSELLRLGADALVKDNAGVTPLDRVRKIMNYVGPSEYMREVARVWNTAFVIEGSVLREKTGDESG
ncbi:putative nacht and ankyrin domain protein [Eutypa lata UCREL1]|uniref:Putative nacht and ankyrin domain protein n=1 Tax=Eutypa lata (strain UCR-EL1) TaxID=1287681 RepID=M7SKH6_EUTLA|nr:putative nacht and ankyrin domain protein [Eutypa lata UCREL1]